MDPSVAQRFWSKVDRTGECWTWIPQGGAGGYAYFYFRGRQVLAHRFIYEQEIGPIPDGLVLDHTCKRRNCVRPSHLEPVTYAENNERAGSAEAGAAYQRSKTCCPQGHPYNDENTYIRPDRSRSCRACQRISSRKSYAVTYSPHPKTIPTHCKRGHEFTPENTRVYNGKRICRACRRKAA